MTSIRSLFVRNPFAALVACEWRRGAGRLAVAAALIALADGYFLVRYRVRPFHAGAALLLPLASLPVLAVVFGFEALRNEWKEQTHHLLLSLPVRGVTVVGAKALVLAAQLLLLAALAAGVAWWHLGYRVVFPPLDPMRLADVAAHFPLWVKTLAAVSAFLPLLNLAVASLTAFLFGQALCRGRWLLAGLAMAGLAAVVLRLHVWEPVWALFSLLPDVELRPFLSHQALAPGNCASPDVPCVLALGWPAMNLAVLAVLLAVAAVLWERKAEV